MYNELFSKEGVPIAWFDELFSKEGVSIGWFDILGATGCYIILVRSYCWAMEAAANLARNICKKTGILSQTVITRKVETWTPNSKFMTKPVKTKQLHTKDLRLEFQTSKEFSVNNIFSLLRVNLVSIQLQAYSSRLSKKLPLEAGKYKAEISDRLKACRARNQSHPWA